MQNKLSFTYDIKDSITPLDGRNRHKLTAIAPYLSEFALDKSRILVELKYIQKLSEYKIIRKLTRAETVSMYRYIDTFNEKDYREIRRIEVQTNHDMKAVEEFIRLKLRKTSLSDIVEMVHFGLTSDDTNNIAYALMIKNSLEKVIMPELAKVESLLRKYAKEYKTIQMLARTHGQPAAPTTVGKEFLVYYKRLKEEMKRLGDLEIKAKLTGNVGNLNAHKFLLPDTNWLNFSEEFVSSFGIKPDLVTTQIEPYDSYIQIFNQLLAINNILLGLCQDMWIYIMLGYFKQKVIEKEVGSTALPHKVNPIYFEGAEGGFGIANGLFEFYCRKLSYSRLQRDLSDSTVRRSFGIAFGYSVLSYQSLVEALLRIEPNKVKIENDLQDHWEVLSEAIQNFLRVKGYDDGYEKTKQFFRGKQLKKEAVFQFIESLKLNPDDKKKLLKLTPQAYTGYAEELINKFL